MNITKIATAATFAAVLVLTGCSNGSTPETTPATPTVTSPAPVETVTPTEAPAEVPTDSAIPTDAAPLAGDTVTAEQAEALPQGQRAYEMGDGSLVVIDDRAPLPETVRAEMTAPIVELGQVANAGFELTMAGDQAAADTKKAIGEQIAATAKDGRNFYVITVIEGDAGTFYSAITGGGRFLFDAVPTKDEAIQIAQDTADRRNEAGTGGFHEVIVP